MSNSTIPFVSYLIRVTIAEELVGMALTKKLARRIEPVPASLNYQCLYTDIKGNYLSCLVMGDFVLFLSTRLVVMVKECKKNPRLN